MASAPLWKVFNPSGEYIASCKHAEDAAAIIALYGGGEIRAGHSKQLTVWREGQEESGSATDDGFDMVARVCHERLDAMIAKNRTK